ncbi:helicase C-terminal domain-containing protein [Geopseudomonas aromaticivorans]
MEYVQISAVDPPSEGRARWARQLLSKALDNGTPLHPVPMHRVTHFTCNMPPHVADLLRAQAKKANLSVPQAAAGLIAAELAQEAAPAAQDADSPATLSQSLSTVRTLLHPLVEGIQAAMGHGKIAFAEASTGSGKGKMICHLAREAAAEGRSVVISAPLPIIWQMSRDFAEYPGPQPSVSILLGRPNFVAPEALKLWAEAAECAPLLEWIDNGGPPLSPRARLLGERLGIPLAWLLEDAISLADDLPVSAMMLSAHQDDTEDCPAEAIYRQLRDSAHAASIILCSHHLLAFHCYQQTMWRGAGKAQQALPEIEQVEEADEPRTTLPAFIDTLLVDEAHLLENAFAAIFSQTLHLQAFGREIERSLITGRKRTLDAIEALAQCVAAQTKITREGRKEGPEALIGPLDTMPGLAVVARGLLDALDALNLRKKDHALRESVSYARRTLINALSGSTTIKLELSPVRLYPMITTGRANLETPFKHLWDHVAGGALVSATLYSDGQSKSLTRWKLGVPEPRCAALPAVTPRWVIDAVRLRLERVPTLPDDSDTWLDELAERIERIARDAKGGTLALCTSYATVAGVAQRLQDRLGDRLLVQTSRLGASACAAAFRTHGRRPVWLGVGNAWTGIDLSAPSDPGKEDFIPAAEDQVLTDLVITRLPLGLNRSLTHHRRQLIAGFRITIQEGAWHLRQGIGRLVRREGVPSRNLWVLDSRIDSKEPWLAAFRKILKTYQVYDSAVD